MHSSLILTRANQITLGRLLLVPVFSALALTSAGWGPGFRYIPLCVFLLAALLDFLDGYIARRYGEVTTVGTMLDPLADKILMLAALFVILSQEGKSAFATIPPWLFYIVVFRETVLLSGAAVLIMINGKLTVKPHVAGKSATFVLVLLIVLALAGTDQSIIDIFSLPAAFLILLSLILYIADGIRQIVKPENSL